MHRGFGCAKRSGEFSAYSGPSPWHPDRTKRKSHDQIPQTKRRSILDFLFSTKNTRMISRACETNRRFLPREIRASWKCDTFGKILLCQRFPEKLDRHSVGAEWCHSFLRQRIVCESVSGIEFAQCLPAMRWNSLWTSDVGPFQSVEDFERSRLSLHSNVGDFRGHERGLAARCSRVWGELSVL